MAGSTFDFTGNLDIWCLGHLLFAAAGFLAVLAVRGPHRIEAGFNSVALAWAAIPLAVGVTRPLMVNDWPSLVDLSRDLDVFIEPTTLAWSLVGAARAGGLRHRARTE